MNESRSKRIKFNEMSDREAQFQRENKDNVKVFQRKQNRNFEKKLRLS